MGFAACHRALVHRDKRGRRGRERAPRDAPVGLGLDGRLRAVYARLGLRSLEVRVSVLKLGFLFWLLVLLAAAFARYVVLALLDDDRALAVAAAVAFVLMCAAAVMVALGMLS